MTFARRIAAVLITCLTFLVVAGAVSANPTVKYTYSPSTPYTGEVITFDGSTTTCDRSPCTFVWQDDGPDGSGGTQWPLAPNGPAGQGACLNTACSKMSFNFGGSGPKRVRLVVTNARGSKTSLMKSIDVLQGPRPVPTPTATPSPSPTPTATPSPTPTATPSPSPTPTATPSPTGCDRNATTSTLAAQFAAATPGQTLCLASGAYGEFTGGAKASPGVTLKPAEGAVPTMTFDFEGNDSWTTLDGIKITGGHSGICGGVSHITIRNAEVRNYVQVGGCGGPSFNNSAITLGPDLNFTYADDPNGTGLFYEGRLSIMAEGDNDGSTPTGILVIGDTFPGPSCADGIFSNTGGWAVVDTVFKNLLQGNCDPHVDSIQWYAGASGIYRNVVIDGDYFVNDQTGLADYDSQAVNTQITNTVFDTVPGPGINPCAAICLAGGQNTHISHVTMRQSFIETGPNHSGLKQTGMVLTDSILQQAPGTESGVYTRDHNLCLTGTCTGTGSLNGTPTWVGGLAPSTYAGFALADGALGKLGASDGTDIGVNP